jgi:hypothetical protein
MSWKKSAKNSGDMDISPNAKASPKMGFHFVSHGSGANSNRKPYIVRIMMKATLVRVEPMRFAGGQPISTSQRCQWGRTTRSSSSSLGWRARKTSTTMIVMISRTARTYAVLARARPVVESSLISRALPTVKKTIDVTWEKKRADAAVLIQV